MPTTGEKINRLGTTQQKEQNYDSPVSGKEMRALEKDYIHLVRVPLKKQNDWTWLMWIGWFVLLLILVRVI